ELGRDGELERDGELGRDGGTPAFVEPLSSCARTAGDDEAASRTGRAAVIGAAAAVATGCGPDKPSARRERIVTGSTREAAATCSRDRTVGGSRGESGASA